MRMPNKSRLLSLFILCGLGTIVFYPGLKGPFIFDDQANILSNIYITIHNLNLSTIYLSAASGSAGPLGRPIPMMSFALNYYFSGGFDHTLGFKLTNLVIHLVNGYLVYLILSRLILLQIRAGGGGSLERLEDKQLNRIALFLAALWVIHPIQVNAVFYVVQRMATLSAMFLMLGLIAYLKLRMDKNISQPVRIFLFTSFPVFLMLGLMSKENAILLIPFIWLIEYFYFGHSSLMQFIRKWRPKSTIIIFSLVLSLLVLFVVHLQPGYINRDFNLQQRLMTEGRILVFYLGLIFFPLLYRFGLFHDDIVISTGLLNPTTTLFSLCFLVIISVIAISYRKQYPFLLIGWLWFLIAHSLESTFVPLELAHEHRNYVALLGPLFACAGLAGFVYRQLSQPTLWLVVPLIVGTFASLSYLRSNDWSSYQELIVAESGYHPNSPRAQAALGALLVGHHLLPQGLEAMSRAHDLQPDEAGFLLNMLIINHMMGKKTPEDWVKELEGSFKKKPVSALSMQVLDYAYDCTFSTCREISGIVESLAKDCSNNGLNSASSRSRCIYYDGLLAEQRGNKQYAIQRFRDSVKLDQDFLRPTMQIALVQLKNRNYTEARTTIKMLIQRNKHTRFKKNMSINNLISLYNRAIRDSEHLPLKPVVN
ncbi:MAG: tetratricopeptide repeat protein [Acidiferrobacterales bacterium]